MPIVDPGPFWKVDFAHERPKTEFHTVDCGSTTNRPE